MATFGHRDNRNHWLTVAQMFGGIYLVGPLGIAEVDTQADAQAVQHALGGTIRLKGKRCETWPGCLSPRSWAWRPAW
jgi:hypothetical protein